LNYGGQLAILRVNDGFLIRQAKRSGMACATSVEKSVFCGGVDRIKAEPA
jgi:hypothetical protein